MSAYYCNGYLINLLFSSILTINCSERLLSEKIGQFWSEISAANAAERMKIACYNVQEDQSIQKQITSKIGSSKEPVKVIDVTANQHALDMWEPLCDTGKTIPNEPLLILPDSYAFADDKSLILKKMAEIFWANELVSSTFTHLLLIFEMLCHRMLVEFWSLNLFAWCSRTVFHLKPFSGYFRNVVYAYKPRSRVKHDI